MFNNGIVSPGLSPGRLTIVGNYTQGPLGLLDIELAGTQQGVTYDWLEDPGLANLAGTLGVTLLNGFRPTAADRFTFMTYSARTGDFTTFNLPGGASLGAFGEQTIYVLRFPFLLENDALKEAKRLNDRFYTASEESEADPWSSSTARWWRPGTWAAPPAPSTACRCVSSPPTTTCSTSGWSSARRSPRVTCSVRWRR